MPTNSVPTAKPPAKGCWADIFELTQFRGRTRRLHGPADYPGIRSRVAEWGLQIESLIVGPEAYVLLYDAKDFEKSITWFLPDQSVQDVVHFDVDVQVDSIRLVCDPPGPNDPGYAAYVKAVGRKPGGPK